MNKLHSHHHAIVTVPNFFMQTTHIHTHTSQDAPIDVVHIHVGPSLPCVVKWPVSLQFYLWGVFVWYENMEMPEDSLE